MTIKTMTAMLLIVLGLVAITWGVGVHPIPLSPLAGILAIGTGVVFFVFDVRKLVPAAVRS